MTLANPPHITNPFYPKKIDDPGSKVTQTLNPPILSGKSDKADLRSSYERKHEELSKKVKV